MKRIKYFLFILTTVSLLLSCTKYEKINHTKGEMIDLFTTPSALSPKNEKVTFGISQKSDSYQWYLDGQKVSTSSRYDYTAISGGKHTIRLDISSGSYTCYAYTSRAVTLSSSKWISTVLQYKPAPGQNINDPDWGTEQNAQSLIGTSTAGVSLGGFGGYIVFGFDHTVQNNEGYDFVIKGNASKGGSEPGCVMVAYDFNDNGVPDNDEWFELKGENHSLSSTIKNYTVTYLRPNDLTKAMNVFWQDNKGNEGILDSQVLGAYHSQSYWPLFVAPTAQNIVYSGTCLVGLLENRSTPNEQLWYRAEAGKGYVDNYSSEYPDVVNLDNDTAGSNKFDISWAVDASGNAVLLPGIDFIKVYTAINDYAGWLGEGSTEVCGAISLSVKNNK